jgi:hypothetical protein
LIREHAVCASWVSSTAMTGACRVSRGTSLGKWHIQSWKGNSIHYVETYQVPSTITWGIPSLTSKVLWQASVPPGAFFGQTQQPLIGKSHVALFLLPNCEACNFAVGYLYRYRTGLQKYCW